MLASTLCLYPGPGHIWCYSLPFRPHFKAAAEFWKKYNLCIFLFKNENLIFYSFFNSRNVIVNQLKHEPMQLKYSKSPLQLIFCCNIAECVLQDHIWDCKALNQKFKEILPSEMFLIIHKGSLCVSNFQNRIKKSSFSFFRCFWSISDFYS